MDRARKATLEDAWEIISELGRAQLELKESQKRTDLQIEKTMKSIERASGNFNNKWGQFLENLVSGDLVSLLQQRGIRVDKIKPRVKYLFPDKNIGTEFDLIAVNGFEIVVIEIKTTLSDEKLKSFLEKLVKLRGWFPEYADKKVYGAVAYMKADGNSAKRAMEEGLFLIKAPGGSTKVSTLVNPDGFSPKSF